jgi:hypothetical protein
MTRAEQEKSQRKAGDSGEGKEENVKRARDAIADTPGAQQSESADDGGSPVPGDRNSSRGRCRRVSGPRTYAHGASE